MNKLLERDTAICSKYDKSDHVKKYVCIKIKGVDHTLGNVI